MGDSKSPVFGHGGSSPPQTRNSDKIIFCFTQRLSENYPSENYQKRL